MQILLLLLTCTWGLVMGNPNQAFAEDFQKGQSVVLEAKKPKGVPLHREPSPSYLKHVPNSTTATIQDIAQDPHWLAIQLASGERHWVHKKYVRLLDVTIAPSSSPAPSPPSPPPTLSPTKVGGEDEAWTNSGQCQAALQHGFRMSEASPATLRIATWNLRWFPIGTPPDQTEGSAESTDLDWVTCAIRWMQVDVLAIQESLATPQANEAWKTLTATLSQQTGQNWRWHRQSCGRAEDHHIGVLWNDSRAALSKFDSLWQFNAKAESSQNPCTYGLRPGYYAYVKSREPNGADFHLISVHLKSGPTVFALEERQKALNRIDKAVAPLLAHDQDVVILGDFNTMGAGDRQSQTAELKYLRRFVAKEKPGFSDLPIQPQCSHYFRGHAGQLDHVLVSSDMKEIAIESIRATGYCALAGCQRIRGDYPLAYRRLSDHCPLVVEIANLDDD